MAKNKKENPQGLSEWQDQLQEVALPVDPRVKTAALQKLNSSTGNATNIATILMEDPGMCLLLMREANKVLQRSDNETHSLSHTISLLGFPFVETLLRRAKDYDKKHFTHFAAYRQQLSTSLHAAYQVEAWAAKNPYWPTGEMFWAALFQRAPNWALWCHAGEQMLQLQHLRARHHSSSHSDLEVQVFGCKLHELNRLVSRRWNLPKLTQESWQLGTRGTARQWIMLSQIDYEQQKPAMENLPSLLRVCSSPAFGIALANQLADESEWDWNSSQTLRLQKILATALQIPVEQSIALAHQEAVNATRQYTIRRALTPAQQLLSGYRKAQHVLVDTGTEEHITKEHRTKEHRTKEHGSAILDTEESDPTKLDHKKQTTVRPVDGIEKERLVDSANTSRLSRPHPKKKSAQSQPEIEQPSTKNKAELTKIPPELASVLQRLKLHSQSFKNKHEILDLALRTMHDAIGLERATISLLNRKTKNLRCLYDYGCENSPALTQFNHTLVRGDFFNKLLQKTVSIQLNSGNHSKVSPLLPDNFKEAINTNEFLMMSIFVEKIPTAVIYADCAKSNGNISAQQYRFFKQLCAAVSQCLEKYDDS